MPLDEEGKGLALEWLRRAKSNLTRASGAAKPADVLYEDLCFDAQQCAEKAIKAVLIYKNIPFRYVHDIAELLTQVKNAGLVVSEALQKAAVLTEFAVETRYPGVAEPVLEKEYLEAVRISQIVFDWAAQIILGHE